MATLTAKRKEEIAKELRIAATWVGGPRQVKLLALAEEIGGLDAEQAQEKAENDLDPTVGAKLKAEAKEQAQAQLKADKDKADKDAAGK